VSEETEHNMEKTLEKKEKNKMRRKRAKNVSATRDKANLRQGIRKQRGGKALCKGQDA